MSTEQMRSEFEQAMKEQFGDLVDLRHVRNGDDEYMSFGTTVAWRMWQASHNLSDHGFSLERDYLNDKIAYWKLQAKVGAK